MAAFDNWRMLLQNAGVGTPALLDCDSADQARPNLFRLPAELRIEIYSHLLDGESNPICHVWSSHLYVKLRRPPALANLLLTCKAFYLDAVCVPFTAQTFDVVFRHSAFLYPFAHLPEFDHGIVLDEPHGFQILCAPLRMRVAPRLSSPAHMISALLRLQRVVRARQDWARKTEVVLSMDKVDVRKKMAVLKSLRKFLEGLACDVIVTGIGDVHQVWEDEDTIQGLEGPQCEKDISNEVVRLRFRL